MEHVHPMHVVMTTTRAADGTTLLQRTWLPTGAATSSALLVHGLGEHSGRYDHVAAALTALGVVVRSWDQRGFGGSGGPRGAIPSSEALVEDARLMFERLAAERRAAGDDAPPFVIGHSMGGCIVARAVTGGVVAPRGMVLSSPALEPVLSRPQLLATMIADRLAPNLTLPHGISPEHLSHDPAVVAAVRADVAMHDRVTPRVAAFMVVAGRRAIEDARRCHVPTLLLVAGADRIVRPEGARRFHANLPAGVGTLRVYEGLHHEIFNETAAEREQVIADLVGWMGERLGARKAGG